MPSILLFQVLFFPLQLSLQRLTFRYIALIIWHVFISQGKGSQRLAQFKKGVDHAEARRSRSETTIQIRKQNKDEMLAKRRQMVSKDASGAETGAIFHTSAFTGNTDVPSSGTARMMSEATRQQIAEHRANIFTDDPMKQYASTQHFRRLLSIERGPPIQEVIDAGVVPRFVQFLQMGDHPVRYL
jgi:hypothetical protein